MSVIKKTNWGKKTAGAYVDISGFARVLNRLNDISPQEMEELTTEAANYGADRMVEYIGSRATDNLWEKPWNGKIGSFVGRVTTGTMINAVGARSERGPEQSRAAFGWIRNVKDYFKYQENGFWHVLAGYRVEPMFALRDARIDVVNKMPSLIRKYEKRIAKRVK
jgi:hypothetical protein